MARPQLTDYLAEVINADKGEPVSPPRHYTEQVQPTYTEPCRKCGGSGLWGWRRDRRCFGCDGKGSITFKTSPAARQKNRATSAARTAARKERIEQEGVDSFKAANPDVWAWIQANPNFEFARSLGESVRRFGSLTEKQLAAANRCVQKVLERSEKAQERVNAAPAVEVAKIEEAFQKASNAGLRRLKLRLDTFEFTPASASGKNPGAIYVKEQGEYLGKVAGGKFLCVRTCGDERRDRVVAAAADPEAAAIAYGKRFGQCSCCGRALSDPESVSLGIGPVCRERFF